MANANPTCSLSVSASGLVTMTASDNYKLAYNGFSSSYSGTSTSTKQLSGAETVTCYVKDTSGNTGSSSITVKHQANATKCGTQNTCSGACTGNAGYGPPCSSRNYNSCTSPPNCTWNSCVTGSANSPNTCYYEE